MEGISWEDGFMQAIRFDDWNHLPICFGDNVVGRKQLLTAIECATDHLRERMANTHCSKECALSISDLLQILKGLHGYVSSSNNGERRAWTENGLEKLKSEAAKAENHSMRWLPFQGKEHTFLLARIVATAAVPVIFLSFLLIWFRHHKENVNGTLGRVAILQVIMGSYGPMLDACGVKYWTKKSYMFETYMRIKRVVRLITEIMDRVFPVAVNGQAAMV